MQHDQKPRSVRDNGPRLLLELAARPVAIPLEEVAGLADAGAMRPIPLAPAAVAGLTEWRGTLLTVFDLERLLGDVPGSGPATLVRLVAPFDHTAIRARGPVRLALDGADVPTIRPAELIERLWRDRQERPSGDRS